MLDFFLFVLKNTAKNTAKKKSVSCPALQGLLRKRSLVEAVFNTSRSLRDLELDDLGPSP